MEKYIDDMTCDLQELISIPSVEGNPKKGMPFGKGVNDALQYTLQKASTMGFETQNFDGYAGHILYGCGERVAVLCHLDVVPEGTGWIYPPFGKTVIDQKIYGRGAIDNKGSIIACLYALKALKDEGYIPNKQITFILGCDEESGWKCMEYYKSKQQLPKTGFSPDADFPVIYAEKGVLHIQITCPVSTDFSNKITLLNGGTRANVVCENAKFIADKTYKFQGVSAHGSTPQHGKNAFKELFAVLNGIVECDNCKVIEQKLLSCTDGKHINLELSDDKSGSLTTNIGAIEYSYNSLKIQLDIRYPVTYNIQEILNRLTNALGENFSIQVIMHHAPLYVEKHSPLIQKLMSAFESVTGKKQEPISIGGGTYARVLQEGVAFGPMFQGQEEVVHKPNEYIEISHLLQIAKIYKQAIKNISS